MRIASEFDSGMVGINCISMMARILIVLYTRQHKLTKGVDEPGAIRRFEAEWSGKGERHQCAEGIHRHEDYYGEHDLQIR